ncbi:MAG: EAL domain-containing protein [Rhodomicrobium sp.]|nr:EAL domain-containing protein [Rhodomicrobium sp.]
MYRAKRSGADRIELYKPEMRGERSEREVIEAELKQAIEKRQIRVLYQPIMRLGDEQLAGFAAQVRWQHPKLGALSAAEFLPIAEDNGQISEISTYVMERAVRQVARWHRTLPRTEEPLFVSINVSSRHLFKQELVQDLRLIIGRESVPKGCLRLELTESLIMENPEQAIEILDWLKQLGAGIALDEFGAGYSSLSYLHRLSVDMIKIDRSLISHSSDNKSGAVVLRAALAMARELGKDVVAVGIEREEDVAYVRALGCEYAQGFYFGEPMSEREVMSLINALSKSNKREEKRQKKKQEPAPAIAAAAVEKEAALLPPPDPALAPLQAPFALPVPLAQHPASKAASLRRKRSGLFASIGKSLGGVSQKLSPSAIGGKIFGAFKSAKKPAKPKAPAARKAPGPKRDPQSLRSRLSQVDPVATKPQVSQGMLQQPPTPPQPPYQPAPPHQPAAHGVTAGSDSRPDYRQAEPMRDRRRGG